MKMRQTFFGWMVWLIILLLVAPPGLLAQGTPAGSPPAGEKDSPPQLKPEELDQMVAPIALYPDSLLAQVLMAATYPLEVVQADRWLKSSKDLKGEKLNDALEKKNWEPSVKSLVPFPQVLAMMSEKLEWTQKLGDAFLNQQKDVMGSVQRLRAKAQASGNLKTTKEQKVIVQKEIIVIEPATQVIYVPAYNPTVVYGVWAYPAYPPYPVYPPGYVAATAAISFGVGVAVGAAMYGGVHWGGGYGGGNVYVNNSVNVNRQTNINQTNINQANINKANVNTSTWQHSQSGAAKSQTQQNPSARGYGQGGNTPQTQGATQRSGGSGAGIQSQGASQRSGGSGAFSGAGNGASERASSSRGQSSRGSASASSGGRSGGGGGSRGGGRGR